MKRKWLIVMLGTGLLQYAGITCQARDVFSRVTFFRPAAASAIPARPPAVMRIALAGRAPVIDGRLDDACWQAAKPFSPFVVYRTPVRATENREVRMAFDQDNLYIAITLDKKPGYKLKADTRTNDDSHMWLDDEVEFFIDPGLNYTDYYQIIVNSSGNYFDAHHWYVWEQDPAAAEAGVLRKIRRSDTGWSSGVELKVNAGPADADKWYIEMRIPIRPMGLPAIPLGSRWGLNISSNNPRTRELTNWIPGDWHNPETYGQVVFGTPRLGVRDNTFGNLRQGENLFSATFTNLQAKSRTYRLRMIDAKNPASAISGTVTFELEPGKSSIQALAYRFAPRSEGVALAAQVHDDSGQLLFQAMRSVSAVTPLYIEIKPYGLVKSGMPVTGRMEIRLGDLSLPRSSLRVKLVRGAETLSTQTLAVRNTAARFEINAADLQPGQYCLKAVLVNTAGTRIAQATADFALAMAPF